MKPSKNALKTDRLTLRRWKSEDLPLFAKMCGDKEVMEHFPAPLSFDETKAFIAKIEKEFETKPYGLWAVEITHSKQFIGYVGLHYQDFEATFAPCVEIGWRLGKEFWGKGYATESAKKVLEYAFSIGIDRVYSFTLPQNVRSIGVMKKIGMKYVGEFVRKELDRLYQKHVLYQISAPFSHT